MRSYSRKGLYLRCICGINKGLIQNKRIIFLTLTTSGSTGDGLSDSEKMWLVQRSWNLLRRRLERSFNCKFEFISVVTNEGNGVLHILISGLPFIYWKRIVRWWNYYHGSQVVSIAKFKGSPEKMSSYLMSQYLSNQNCIFRYKMSNNWICGKFMYYWRLIKDKSRDYSQPPKCFYGFDVFPVDMNKLKAKFGFWIRYYVNNGVRLL